MSAKDLKKAYAEVHYKIAQSWVFNCDSGCFSEICDREAFTVGTILVIYQPHKSMREYDDMYATIFFKRVDKKAITASFVKQAKLNEIDSLVLQSYNEILVKSNNKWTHAIDGSLEQLIQMKKPLRVEQGALKFTFEIRGATNGCCGDRWFPHRLAEWQGEKLPEEDDAEQLEFLENLKEPATPANLN